jgi:hypothetical protein
MLIQAAHTSHSIRRIHDEFDLTHCKCSIALEANTFDEPLEVAWYNRQRKVVDSHAEIDSTTTNFIVCVCVCVCAQNLATPPSH